MLSDREETGGTEKMREKVRVRGGGREGERGDKQGKNSLPQLADLGNPAILQQPESRSR